MSKSDSALAPIYRRRAGAGDRGASLYFDGGAARRLHRQGHSAEGFGRPLCQRAIARSRRSIGAVPVQAIEALPYILTVVLLAGFIGKAIPPKASGVPYVKER